MQQTRLDHLLKDRFCYVYELSCNRLPRTRLPGGVSLTPAPHRMGRSQWSYILRCESEDSYYDCVRFLKAERMLFQPTVTVKDNFLARIVNPENGSSFTYNTVWTGGKLGFFSVFGHFALRWASAFNIAPLVKALQSLSSVGRP